MNICLLVIVGFDTTHFPPLLKERRTRIISQPSLETGDLENHKVPNLKRNSEIFMRGHLLCVYALTYFFLHHLLDRVTIIIPT